MEHSIEELLKVLELDTFPTKEELKKHFKFLLKKYHPDIYVSEDSHDKTISIINAYHHFLMNYQYFLETYERTSQNQINSQKEVQLPAIQIYTYKDILLGLPLKGLRVFIHKNQAKIHFHFQKYFIEYHQKFYKIIDHFSLDLIQKDSLYCFALYDEPENFSFGIREKIKYQETLYLSKVAIEWNGSYGIINHNQRKIYIPNVFKNIFFNKDEVSSY
ncbi:MAG: hypothetical protein NZ853_10350 [Leptospiraceae bacterium]|nr:hypothetical protein [Leptospiraceae bacterium]MDW7974942.1 hypothetical protein [Leptospiraceae bacterium]